MTRRKKTSLPFPVSMGLTCSHDWEGDDRRFSLVHFSRRTTSSATSPRARGSRAHDARARGRRSAIVEASVGVTRTPRDASSTLAPSKT